MSETGFWIFRYAFSIGAEILYAVCLTFFLRPFLVSRGREERKAAVIFLAYLFSSLFCTWIAAPQGTFILILVILLTVFSKALGMERCIAFLLGLFYWNAKVSSGLTAESLYFIVERKLPYHTEPAEAVYLRAAVLLTLLLLTHAVLFAVMLYAFRRQIGKQRLQLHRLEVCYISLLPMAGILFGQVISVLLYELKDGEQLQLYERHPVLLAVVPLLAMLFYMGALLTIIFQQKMALLQEEQAASFMERQQVMAIRERIHEAEQFYSCIRQLKHEMRGHMTNMKGMVRGGKYDSLEAYISRLDESMGDLEMTLQTGNPVTDVIVNDKRRQCQDRAVRFLVDFHYPQDGHYDAFDLGIVLQNLLQNALEASERTAQEERFISLVGKRKGRFFLVEVQNSFAGEIIFGEDGLPVTTKKTDTSMHGIGLANVRRIVGKYMGEMEIHVEGRIFKITAMVQEISHIE